MGNNSTVAPVKTTGLTVYSVICLIVLYGGLACSYIFWKNYVNDQFGLVIPFTFLFFILLNIIFKIPAVVDIVLLGIAIYRSSKACDAGSRRKSIGFMIAVIVSSLLCVVAEFVMFLSTRGSSLG